MSDYYQFIEFVIIDTYQVEAILFKDTAILFISPYCYKET